MKALKTLVISACLAMSGILGMEALTTTETSSIQPNDSKEIVITSRRKCQPCNGTGRMTIKKTCSCKYAGGNGCEKCDYKGYTVTEVQCSTCGGSGEVVTRVEQ